MNSTNLNVTFVDIDCTFSKPELMATLEVFIIITLGIRIDNDTDILYV